MAENQTNPTSVVVTPNNSNILPTPNSANAPLAQGARVSMPTNMGRIPSTPTPITPVRGGRGGRR